jgi:type IX secretion system PorP/SprF family membrane protein
MYNKLFINPAFAGHYEEITLTAVYRNQWSGFPGAPETGLVSANIPFEQRRVGLGLNISQASLGVTDRLTFDVNYAYRVPLSTGHLSIGLAASVRQFKVDFTDPRLFAIHDLSQDVAIDPIKESRSLLNFGTGVYFQARDYYVGFSIPRILSSDLDFDEAFNKSQEVQHVYLMGGMVFPISADWVLKPQALIKYVSQTPIDLDLNISLQFQEKLTAGLTFRTGGDGGQLVESVDLILGVQFLNQWRLGFAYDYTLSSIRQYENGSIEVLVQYFIPQKIKQDIINPRYF